MKTLTVAVTWSSEMQVEVDDDYEFVNGDMSDDRIVDVLVQDTSFSDLDLIDWEVVGGD